MNDMVSSHALHRITTAEFRRMDEACVFASDSKIELIEGELVERVVPMNPPHGKAVGVLNRELTIGLGDSAFVRCQLPITLGDLSEPQPDISIVAMPLEQYDARHPVGAEIFTLIEVADSSRRSDLARKVPLYATHGIPETWVVDLVDSCVRVFRDPRDGEYRDASIARARGTIALLAFPELQVFVASIFGLPLQRS